MTKQCRANGITIGYEEGGAGEPLETYNEVSLKFLLEHRTEEK